MENIQKCTCGSFFSNENNLIEHIKQKHMKTFNTKKEYNIDEILNRFNDAFNDCSVEVFSGEGWYTQFRVFIKKNNTTIEQRIGNSGKYENSNAHPEKVNHAIIEAKKKFALIGTIYEKVNSLGEFDKFHCSEFDYGYSTKEQNFQFIYKLKNSDIMHEARYYPKDKHNNELHVFINDFKKYFVTSLEGIPCLLDDNGGHYDEFGIDGVSIDGIFTRANKVKLEILE